MVGETISHYRILEKLGHGGMGEVYLAEDTRLGRKVALKFMAPELARDHESLARFRNEARAVAELAHPNIATIHDIGEVEGKSFLVLEYVDGQTLKARISQGPLPIEDVLRIGQALAAGLAEAHLHGIVHRDIKSANVMLTDKGDTKILDFGLAHRVNATQITLAGTTLGTIGYMSPEQAGGKTADERSDIWSLGIVLYECLTGSLPFTGEGMAIIEQIKSAEPPPPTAVRSGIPMALERIVLRCMQRDRGLRYQHADELIAELEFVVMASDGRTAPPSELASPTTRSSASRTPWVVAVISFALIIGILGWRAGWFTPQPPGTGVVRLAVLPFENLGAAEDEYFADGITDEITSKLAVIRDLRVISRTSARRYKNTDMGLREIGAELGVDYILEGTIRWDKLGEHDKVRITPQLIKVSDDTHLWAENYEREIEEVFEVQADMASQIAEALNVKLLGAERLSFAATPTKNLDAYEAYLLGLSRAWDLSDEDALRLSIQMFERAVELDPEFAISYCELSTAHSAMHHHGFDRTEERLSQAKAAADKALDLQPELSEAHLALANYYYYGHRDYELALKELAVAERGLPNDSRILIRTGAIWRRQGKFEAAVERFEAALELRPQNVSLLGEVAMSYQYLRRYAQADRYCDLLISLTPNDPWTYRMKAHNYISWRGDTNRAHDVLQEIPGDRREREESSLDLWRLERNYSAILEFASSGSQSITWKWNSVRVPDLLAARTYELMGERELAIASYESARVVLENALDAHPGDHRIHSALSFAYAGLARKEDAIREGKRAVAMYPIEMDALSGPDLVQNLAVIYTMVGEYDAALDQIEYLLSIPSPISYHDIRLDPVFDPLRKHPRFQALVAVDAVH